MNDTPKAQQYATYPADVRHMAERREVVGPNLLGEVLTAVTADYDEATGKTRVGFAYGVHPKGRVA